MNDIRAEEATEKKTVLEDSSVYYPIILDGDGTTFKIVNNGTAAAPCCLTIVPMNDAMKIIIKGLTTEAVSLAPIKKGQIVALDGINKTITLDGEEKFEIYNGWEFPKLQPGENTIKITKADMMKIEISYQPRYI